MPSFRKCVLLAFAIPFLFFVRASSFDFMQLDDTTHLDSNPYFQPVSLENTLKLWARPHAGLYAPLTYSTWALMASVTEKGKPRTNATGITIDFRFHPALFHLANVVLHALSCVLIFLILHQLLSHVGAALVGALFFALHPIQVEPVAWVSSLKDTLSGFFVFSTILTFLLFEKTKRAKFYVAFLFLALCAMLSKAASVVLPIVLFTIGYLGLQKNPMELAKRLLPLAVLSVVFASIAQSLQAGAESRFQVPEFWQRPFIALDAIGFYIGKIILPEPLLLDYGRTPHFALTSVQILLSSFCAALLLIYVYRSRKNESHVLPRLGIIIALTMLLPVLGFVPFFHQTTSTVTNRYMYVALFGVALIVAAFVRMFWGRKELAPLLLSLLVIGSIQSQVQLSRWRDGLTLLSYNVAKRPKSWLSQNNLGSVYERLGNPRKALEHYLVAAQYYPGAVTFNNVGATALAIGELKLAQEAFRKGIEYSSNHEANYHGLAIALHADGKTEDAQKILATGLQQNPQSVKLKELATRLRSAPRSTASK